MPWLSLVTGDGETAPLGRRFLVFGWLFSLLTEAFSFRNIAENRLAETIDMHPAITITNAVLVRGDVDHVVVLGLRLGHTGVALLIGDNDDAIRLQAVSQFDGLADVGAAARAILDDVDTCHALAIRQFLSLGGKADDADTITRCDRSQGCCGVNAVQVALGRHRTIHRARVVYADNRSARQLAGLVNRRDQRLIDDRL